MSTEAQAVYSYVHVPHSDSWELRSTANICHLPDTRLSSQIPHLELQILVCDGLNIEADCCAEKNPQMYTVSAENTASLPDYYRCLICMYSGIFLQSTTN